MNSNNNHHHTTYYLVITFVSNSGLNPALTHRSAPLTGAPVIAHELDVSGDPTRRSSYQWKMDEFNEHSRSVLKKLRITDFDKYKTDTQIEAYSVTVELVKHQGNELDVKECLQGGSMRTVKREDGAVGTVDLINNGLLLFLWDSRGIYDVTRFNVGKFNIVAGPGNEFKRTQGSEKKRLNAAITENLVGMSKLSASPSA